MLKNIIKNLNKLIISEIQILLIFKFLKIFFLHRKIAKLRSSRQAVKFNIINLKKFKIFWRKKI